MFRVPLDVNNPSYDHTRTVSFWEWLTSSKADRLLWRDLRDRAIITSASYKAAKRHDDKARERRRRIMGR